MKRSSPCGTEFLAQELTIFTYRFSSPRLDEQYVKVVDINEDDTVCCAILNSNDTAVKTIQEIRVAVHNFYH
jgi:hypothetical protein